MKKFLSFFAFMAMMCASFGLVSCGGDDDPLIPTPTPTPSNQAGTFTITITSTVVGDDGNDQVMDFIKSKVGNGATIQKETETVYKMQVNDKAKASVAIKGLGEHKAELDKLMKENTKLPFFSFYISDGLTRLFSYEYESEELEKSELMSYGVYTYTDSEGLVWTFTYTDQDAGDGKKVGSLVVPKDVDKAKAGTYEGTCRVSSVWIIFESNQMQGKEFADLPAVYARFGFVTEQGIPTLIKIYDTKVCDAGYFQKVD